MLEQEITILKQVNHANIIHLQQVYDTTRVSAANANAKRDPAPESAAILLMAARAQS